MRDEKKGVDEKFTKESEGVFITICTPHTDERKNIDRSLTLDSFDRLLLLIHADIADIRFFARFAVDRKYCLLGAKRICVSVWVRKYFSIRG